MVCVCVCVCVCVMHPSSLPLPELFTNWSSETGFIVQEASTSWTNFSRWRGVASVDEVSSIVDLMRTLPLDVDMDTVDGMPTLEMFVDNDALRAGRPSKGEFESADRAALREALREALDGMELSWVGSVSASSKERTSKCVRGSARPPYFPAEF